MSKFTIHILINRPPDIVDGALMDPENMMLWTSGLEKFEVVKGTPGEAGALARLHYLERGRTHVMEDVLEYAEPGKKYMSRVSGGGMTARVETVLEPSGGGTEMRLSWEGTGDSILMRIMLRFLRRVIMRRAKSDLETFKKLVETHGAHFGK